jgi:hypothetical protein
MKRLPENQAAELTGNTFKDWYTQEDGGTKVEFPYTAGTKDSYFLCSL